MYLWQIMESDCLHEDRILHINSFAIYSDCARQFQTISSSYFLQIRNCNFLGGGYSGGPKNAKKCMKLNWNFPCGWCGNFLELRISKDKIFFTHISVTITTAAPVSVYDWSTRCLPNLYVLWTNFIYLLFYLLNVKDFKLLVQFGSNCVSYLECHQWPIVWIFPGKKINPARAFLELVFLFFCL